MLEPKFNNVQELKQRLMPALKLRRKELNKQGVLLTEEELWDFFVKNSWKQAINLSLSTMVNDILNKDINLDDKHDII